MTSRRLAISPTKSPALTGGDERPRPACGDRYELIDLVYARGADGRYARERLFKLCGVCALRPECWADKEWRKALREGAA